MDKMTECCEAVFEYVVKNMNLDTFDQTIDEEGQTGATLQIPVPLDTHPMLATIFEQYVTDEPNEEGRSEFFVKFDELFDKYSDRIEQSLTALTHHECKIATAFLFDDDFEINMVDFTSEDKSDFEITDTQDHRGLVVELTFDRA